MLILNTTLTPALAEWLRTAADDGRALEVVQVPAPEASGRSGPDIMVDAPGGLTPAEVLEVTARLAAHAAEPLTMPRS